ncbi:amidohydrolase family protein [Mycobacterium sp. 852002-51057_SCH5723018]|uniref:amidohydrolase family protein n=1 Tax=Mycobacterium sp. 852002-51057_SCH5723018 TaxID=1834094 RepID=UPI0007FD984E|nr:amidohydrolase family protein [Mycobacterium sp. 852002-51057_SCH5723018]OBG28552.1 cytosine deaminase [Mycobacterium sp. 852002-51057_SCH5723018]
MSRTLLRGAQVISMAPNRPDDERVDILIDGDRIAEMDARLDTSDAETVDLSGRIVIPGLVNAHLHTWQTGLRSVGADWTLLEYLARMHSSVAQHYRPDDIYIGTLAGALNQINCGTTSLGDWCHNNPTPEHTDAAVEGLQDSGIRAAFLHGTPNRAPDVAHPIAEIDRLLDGPLHNHELLTLGMAVAGPQYSTPDVAVADFRAADERGVILSMHQSGGEPQAAWQAVRAAGLFGPRTNVVHGAGLTNDWVKLLVEDGVSFTTTPENELGQGHGTPITGALLRLGAAPSLGTDTEAVVAGEILSAARIALAHQRGLDHEHRRRSTAMMCTTASITSKQAMSWATVDGARALGLAERVGRIEPGMQADLVAIDARALNLWPAHDPIAAALLASLANIEAVMIAGQWRKRGHSLVGVDVDSVKSSLLRSGKRLLSQMDTPSTCR